ALVSLGCFRTWEKTVGEVKNDETGTPDSGDFRTRRGQGKIRARGLLESAGIEFAPSKNLLLKEASLNRIRAESQQARSSERRAAMWRPALYFSGFGKEIGDGFFLFTKFLHGGFDLRLAEIVDRQILHDFPRLS